MTVRTPHTREPISRTKPSIAILGLGLMGGSLWRKLVADGFPVTAYDVGPATRMRVRQIAAENGHPAGIVDTISEAVANTDIAVICVPAPEVPTVLAHLHDIGYRGLITDVTSVKAPIQQTIDERYPHLRWVGGHPMVGLEQSGFAASSADLYDNCPWALCLPKDLPDWLALAAFLTRLGCRVVPTTPRDHDDAVARVSHVPHLVAAALTNIAAANPIGPMALTLAAGSFKDGTRVAATRVDRTAAYCGANAIAVSRELNNVIAELTRARDHLRSVDPMRALSQWLLPGYRLRTAWPIRPGTTGQFPASHSKLLELGQSGGWVTAVAGEHITAVWPAPTPPRSPVDRQEQHPPVE